RTKRRARRPADGWWEFRSAPRSARAWWRWRSPPGDRRSRRRTRRRACTPTRRWRFGSCAAVVHVAHQRGGYTFSRVTQAIAIWFLIGAATARAAPTVELYTMGPGDDLFSAFGHAAVCVLDERSPAGRCYNYGTADFRTPLPLTWAFVRGR